MAADTTKKAFINRENLSISKNDYFILTDGSQKRGERKTYIYQYKGSDKLTSDSPVLKFKDIGSGDSITQSYSNASTLATLKVGGADYVVLRIDSGADLNANDVPIRVDMDASGAINPAYNFSIPITTPFGMEINISNTTTANKINVSFLIPDNDRDGTARDATETLLPSKYQLVISVDSSNDVSIGSVVTGLTERTPDGETNVQFAYSAYGTFFTRRSPSSSPGTLEVENPESQRFGQVFITAGGATFTQTAAVTTGAVSIQRIDVGATKLASEVPNINAVNSILVGGPCANAASAEVLGNPADCTSGFEPGVGKVELYDVGSGNVAMLVAGFSAADTRNAAAVVANYQDYTDTLKGEKVEVRKVGSVVTVAAPVEEVMVEDTTTTTDDTTTTT